MKLADIHNVFFIGIGGIGMSALARWFHHQGKKVAGYDRVSTDLSKHLESEGIDIHYEDDVNLLPDWIDMTDRTLVIVTPAIPEDQSELMYVRKIGSTIKKRSEVLGIITKAQYSIAVAGTHGKTTTSSMIAWLLSEKNECSAFVGGIMTNYNSNLLIGKTNSPFVVEADEFDRSFLKLHPNYSVVTSLDPDHLDIYGDADSMNQSYLDFINQTDKNGKILIHNEVFKKVGNELNRAFTTYGLEDGDIQARNIRIEASSFVFDYLGKTDIDGLKLQLPGYHNVSNAVAAITVALDHGMKSELIKKRLAEYAGVKRRFEYILKTDKIIYVDDYAHHPSEVKALLSSLRALYPTRQITAVFQPHLYTRTRDFYKGFAESLDGSDIKVILDIYPARETPIEGITSKIIFDEISSGDKYILSKDEFPQWLDDHEPDVLVTIGAGDIDTLVPVIKNQLEAKQLA